MAKQRLNIPVKEGESIDRALKRFKKKFTQTQMLNELKYRKEYTKKSESKRVSIAKSKYKQRLNNNNS
tara:strand:- start:309 stop:512 length:204 start_codon:yes stop_codon:yes gene_type:complete